MNQQLRILIYFVMIAGLTLVLTKYVTFPFTPAQWQLPTADPIDIKDVDSTALILEENTDTITIPPQVELKDTIITIAHLNCPTVFLQQLDNLHQQLLSSAETKRNIRILHYGDSQIEGDRITAYIRESFQSRFGGSGPGLTTIYDPQHINPSVWLDSKGHWKINSIYNRRYRLPSKTYGLMGQTATLQANSNGQFKISASPWAEKHASHYQKVRLFIAPHVDTLIIKGNIKNTEVINDSIAPSKNLTEINWEFEQLSPTLKFELFSNGDTHILGCALDSTSGVSVDNIALRGQSTPLLHRTDGDLFKAMGEHLDIGMVFFQFGTNIIPTVAPNYHFYKVQMAKQFDLLKTYLPNTPVIIIGLSDAAHVNNGQLESYAHLHRIRDAQKEIALEYGFAFFDLYEAMGGKGSIIEWSQKNPPWALTDYIHLSRKGGKQAANLLTTALWKQMEQLQYVDSILFTQTPQL
ncbi:GDSL-type esterase/lipase family protein [Carboxylicivirga marina]|uniref:SGNH hydrolase-type esterase domain-containing protein n=1 Tax=Carboxylicivirga marina TaxID=2800988 RepID=A0ABS1HJJ1_9BACT|nr:GDSL-type esterase/lipase family protein [Carboxylicivirga marina]MBK3517438.1 hypothetical protein [Carboxylicivirga marina]